MPSARAVFQAHIDGITAASLSSVSVPVTFAWLFEDAGPEFLIIDLAASAPLTLTRPAKATMLGLEPPPTNVTPIVLKGNAADATGVALSPNTATVLALAAVGPVVLFATAAIAGIRLRWM